MSDPQPTTRDIVTIGGSAGGIDALQRVVAQLPADLPAAIFVVIHIPATASSLLPQILARVGSLPAGQPVDGDPIQPGRIVVAPPDAHLLLGRHRVHLSHGPREHTYRPSVDALFRSAAQHHAGRVIGVVLSGMLGDGAVGLSRIVAVGGLGIVQDPADAAFAGMPERAIEVAKPQHVVSLSEIAPLIVNAVGKGVPREAAAVRPVAAARPEVVKMNGDSGTGTTLGDDVPGEPSGYACPDCGGVLWERHEAGEIEMVCRIGHLYNVDSLLEAKNSALEGALWAAVRALEEHVSLLRRLADAQPHGSGVHRGFSEQAADAARQARLLRDVVERKPEKVSS